MQCREPDSPATVSEATRQPEQAGRERTRPRCSAWTCQNIFSLSGHPAAAQGHARVFINGDTKDAVAIFRVSNMRIDECDTGGGYRGDGVRPDTTKVCDQARPVKARPVMHQQQQHVRASSPTLRVPGACRPG